MIRPVWVDIDLSALAANFKKIKNFAGGSTKIAAIIKQSAYGHGLIPLARKLHSLGADAFGVGSLPEAVALREDGYPGKILFLSLAPEADPSCFIKYDITPALFSQDFARKLNQAAKKAAKKIPVHLKVDTGMGRLGIYPQQVLSFLSWLKKFEFIYPEGIFTHLPLADSDKEFTLNQIDLFKQLIKKLKAEKITFKYRHFANSLAILKYPDSYFNMVRPGLSLYGIEPSPGLNLGLKPVMSLKSKVIFIKPLKKGKSVGYGSDFTAPSDCRIATVPVGYGDGYPWRLSNSTKVLIKGKFFEIAGRVCMDHIMINLKNQKDIQENDQVTLIGKDGNKEIKASDLASWAGTISYEILTGVSAALPRFYKD